VAMFISDGCWLDESDYHWMNTMLIKPDHNFNYQNSKKNTGERQWAADRKEESPPTQLADNSREGVEE